MKNKKSSNANPILKSDWISVKDQLPEYDYPVLVCKEGNEKSVWICRLESRTERKESISYTWLEGKIGYDTWYYDVTHWMPLHKPPIV